MTESNCEIKTKNGDTDSLFVNYEVLKELCENNAEYFKNDTSNAGKSIYSAISAIVNNVINVKPLVEHFRSIYPAYDYDENTPGNGYRSYVMMVDAFVVYGVKINRQICLNRNSYFFRKGTALKELEACEQGLCSLHQMLTHLMTLVEWSDKGCLYPRDEHAPEELLSRAHNLNQYCFYGRCLGFQFCESMQTVLKGLAILMASFSEIYYSNGGMLGRATSSLWNSSKYLVNPELRAKRIVNISQYASVNFCKQFWFLGEMETMKRLPSFVSPSVVMNRIIVIPPEPMTIERLDGSILDVPIPSAHTGPSPLTVRLMSSVKRTGMLGEASSKNLAPVADGFMFHCHGGGFVAQSSRSHETYLCQWAKSVDVPILSVDYSLAPEAPFPRALEDTFYAYCWALNNLSMLGTTGQRIVAGGDSAGGNLVLGLTIKCIMEGIRPPDGLFLAYVPVIVSIIPSPARLLCLMDPLLPLGFLTGCLRAYACTPEAYEAAVKGFEDKLRHRSRKSSASNKKSSGSKNGSRNNSIDVGVDPIQQLQEKNAINHGNENGTAKPVTNDKSETVNDVVLNGNSMKDGNYVAGFLDKYVNNETYKDTDNNTTNRNKGSDHNVNDSTNACNDNLVFEAPIPFPPSFPSEPEVNDNDDMKNVGLSSKLTDISTAITSTISSVVCTNGSTQNSSSQANKDDSVAVTNNGGEVIKSDTTSIFDDDFEEVMLPCPLEMLKFEVPHNPLLSPYYADDEILKKFPPVSIMTLHMDPCLDDCVEFAKKMKRLGNDVTLDILEGLPHGFLNFSLLSREAYEGSKKCTERIKQLLDIQSPVIATEATEIV